MMNKKLLALVFCLTAAASVNTFATEATTMPNPATQLDTSTPPAEGGLSPDSITPIVMPKSAPAPSATSATPAPVAPVVALVAAPATQPQVIPQPPLPTK